MCRRLTRGGTFLDQHALQQQALLLPGFKSR